MMEGSTDSFSGNEWELSKENVQPLKKGRKMANLTAALAPSSGDQSRIYKEKQEFEAQIRTYQGDDPLQIWCRYIVWTSENFPKGGKDLGNLLERCMTTFKDQERYRNDERYAKVWLHYTDICTDPVEIFHYMHSQQLCSGLALFFESWAQLQENLGNYKKADEVFMLGIQNNAQPLDRLRKQHRAFELRMTETVANGLHQVSIGDASEPERIALGGLKRQGKKGTVGTQRTGNATISKKSGIASFASLESQTKNAGFTIFCDDDPSACSSLPHPSREWQMPPTQHVIKKENTQKPGKWTDMKVSQRNHASTPLNGIPQRPEFSVHVDEDVVNHPPPTIQDMHFDKVLSARKPNKSFVTEALQNKTEDQTTRVMYCKEKIYAGTEEFSFEELRAARIFQKMKEGTYIPRDTPVPPQNVRYMYPKKEVYSFEGEFQYEEILARRYSSRLKAQDVSIRCALQENLGLPKITGFTSNDQPCQMEIGSCQKSVIPSSSHANEIVHSMSVTQNSLASTARRGLSFATQPLSHLRPEASSNTHFESSFTAQPSILQGGCGKSAFQPVIGGLCIREHQDGTIPRQQNSINLQQRNNPFNMSSCNDTENVFTKPDKQIGIAESLNQKVKLCEQIASTRKTIACSKLVTPDANRSCEFNISNISSASPTVFTKEALLALGDMFRLPLESERRSESENQAENDFEAAFSGDSAAPTHSVSFGAQGGSDSDPGFVIYTDANSAGQNTGEEEIKENDAEDKENMPPCGRRQESVNRPLAGILQPSVGIPFCPLDTEDDYDDEPIGEEDRDELNPQQKKNQADKISELSLAEYSQDQTAVTSASFATAARMASTPFSSGISPSPLPNIPCSTIRLADGNPTFAPDDDVFSSAHVTSGQTTGSFTSPPSQVLSPILEGSHEDSKSTNSSQSSVGSSRPGSCSAIVSQQNGLELSRIQEEPSFHETASAQQETKTGSTVINPFSGEVVDALLRQITPPLSCYFGFFESSEEMPRIATKGSVCFGKDVNYFVERQLGAGAFAKVYLVTTRDPESDRDHVETDDESCVVFKVQKISIEWEFYVSRILHSRMQDLGCSKVLHEMIMNPLAAYVYSNSSVLLDTYEPLGTILDMVNNYKSNKKKMEEGVIFFYTIALLRILETLHYCDIIHGDIKPDNFLVLDRELHTPDGAPLRIIDFGRSIDMRLFPTGTTFTTDCHTDGFQCVEMKEGRPWTKQIDTYGMLGTIHCFLFLDYMKVYKDAHGKWRITKAFARHWNPVWSKLFNSLLNITSCEEQPSLRDFREEFEKLYLADEANHTRQKRLHHVFMFSCSS